MKEGSGTVYLIHAVGSDFYKIGWTSGSVSERVKSLQCGCPFSLCVVARMPGDRSVERDLHERLREARVHGEWFTLTFDQMFNLFQEMGGHYRRNPNIPSSVGAARETEYQRCRDQAQRLLAS